MTDDTPTPESTPSTNPTPDPKAEVSKTDVLLAKAAGLWADKKKRKYLVLGAFAVVILLLVVFGPHQATTPSGLMP